MNILKGYYILWWPSFQLLGWPTFRLAYTAYTTFLEEVARLDIERQELLVNLDTSIRNVEVLSNEIERVERLKENPENKELNDGLIKDISDIVTIDEELSNKVIVIKPKYLRNLTSALVLGIMIGGFVAFLKNYPRRRS